jgi:hypothetical protein
MHSGEDREPVVRLYERLAEALQRTRPAGFDAPVSVAEIYQELVPYRAVRSEVGFGMNADYEHVLLRLLAGEAELVRLEPDTAREEILRELRSANPNVSVYRAYAGCDVWVRPRAGVQPQAAAAATPPAAATVSDAQPRVAPVSDASTRAAPVSDATSRVPSVRGATPRAAPVSAAAPGNMAADSPARAASAAIEKDVVAGAQRSAVPAATGVTAGAAASREVEAAPARAGAEAGAAPRSECVFCESVLPVHRAPRYCPHCGADQTTRPCRSCGEPLEPGWTFCVACGAADSRAPGA